MHNIIMLNSKKYPGLVTIIDEEDYKELVKYKWYPVVDPKNNTIYVSTTQDNHKTIIMHRFIMQLHGNNIKNKMIDHEDHNGLNNQKENLRICTRSKNLQNSKKPKDAFTSKYKGVDFRKDRNKYRALIMLDKKKYFIGHFDNEEDAAKAYDSKAIELFGEFAYLNFSI